MTSYDGGLGSPLSPLFFENQYGHDSQEYPKNKVMLKIYAKKSKNLPSKKIPGYHLPPLQSSDPILEIFLSMPLICIWKNPSLLVLNVLFSTIMGCCSQARTHSTNNKNIFKFFKFI